MKRSACLPLLALTAVLLCKLRGNTKRPPRAPTSSSARSASCNAQRRRHHRHLLHQFGRGARRIVPGCSPHGGV